MNMAATLPVLCVTDRAECPGGEAGLFSQLEHVLALPATVANHAVSADAASAPLPRPTAVLLREKDLDEAAYARLATQAAAVCSQAGVPLVVHSHARVARELGCTFLHLTLPALEAMPARARLALAKDFELSTSCHAVEDAHRAFELGCARIIAGHVYSTSCKPGIEPRGLAFLREICAATPLPVWAIGGITPERFPELAAAGAAGVCIRSLFMRENSQKCLRSLAGQH